MIRKRAKLVIWVFPTIHQTQASLDIGSRQASPISQRHTPTEKSEGKRSLGAPALGLSGQSPVIIIIILFNISFRLPGDIWRAARYADGTIAYYSIRAQKPQTSSHNHIKWLLCLYLYIFTVTLIQQTYFNKFILSCPGAVTQNMLMVWWLTKWFSVNRLTITVRSLTGPFTSLDQMHLHDNFGC